MPILRPPSVVQLACLLTLALLASGPSMARAALSLGPLPSDAPDGFDRFFSRHVEVLGVHVYATSDTPSAKVLHAAAVLAEYLDNDEDGEADDPRVLEALTSRHASLVMWPTEQAFERSGFDDEISDQVFDSTTIQPLFGAEAHGHRHRQRRSADVLESTRPAGPGRHRHRGVRLLVI